MILYEEEIYMHDVNVYPELFMERFIINTVHNIDLARSQLKNKPIFILKKGILIL